MSRGKGARIWERYSARWRRSSVAEISGRKNTDEEKRM